VRTLVDYRPALRSRTGVGEYVHELARALVRTQTPAEHPAESLFLFSSSWADRLDPHVIPGATTIDCRVPVQLLNYAWHRWEWPPVELLASALGGRPDRQFDVVQSLHPLLLPSRHAAQLVTIHDLDFLDHPERTSAEIRRDYAALASDHASRADRVIAVSHFTAGEITRRLGIPAERISICSPGAPDWSPRSAEAASGYVLFLGTLEPRKNVGTLVEAYAQLMAARPASPTLVLAGRMPDEGAPWSDRLRSAPLAGRVELRGYVAPENRRALMAGAAVLVMPSFMEGFGIPALEAMSLGVPVIVSDRGALPEVVGDAGLIFDPADPAALAGALTRVLDDVALRRGMSERGLVRAKAYSWDHTAAETRQAWRLAINSRRAARRG
jgi:glycosyltransferase involved in cell wall biosynthesis